ncbi:MAG: hypothetical protein HOA66_09060 [Candidatus Marinimicrobia bacterium]|jgi:hypothetical protein|nr:hypothetical protein [Candidatus Neomarinimicrobiota bacterium]
MKLLYPLIILFAFSFAQYGKDFEDMSQSEKHMIYNSHKKSPALGVLYEVLLPTSGYAYAHKWKRGLILNSIQLTSFFIGIGYKNSVNQIDSNISAGCSWDDCSPYRADRERDERNSVLGFIGFIGISIYKLYDISNQLNNYNNRVYREIFGKEPPSFSLNLQPSYNGANLNLSYSFK